MDAKCILPMLSLIQGQLHDTSTDAYDSRFVESKGGFHLVIGDLPRDLGDILVEHATHVLVIAEDERLFEIEATCNDILGVLSRELLGLLGFELMLEQELFVV